MPCNHRPLQVTLLSVVCGITRRSGSISWVSLSHEHKTYVLDVALILASPGGREAIGALLPLIDNNMVVKLCCDQVCSCGSEVLI